MLRVLSKSNSNLYRDLVYTHNLLLYTAESKMFLFLKFRYTVSTHFYEVLLDVIGVYYKCGIRRVSTWTKEVSVDTHSLCCLSSFLSNHTFPNLAFSSIRFKTMKPLTHKITSPQSLHLSYRF